MASGLKRGAAVTRWLPAGNGNAEGLKKPGAGRPTVEKTIAER